VLFVQTEQQLSLLCSLWLTECSVLIVQQKCLALIHPYQTTHSCTLHCQSYFSQ